MSRRPRTRTLDDSGRPKLDLGIVIPAGPSPDTLARTLDSLSSSARRGVVVDLVVVVPEAQARAGEAEDAGSEDRSSEERPSENRHPLAEMVKAHGGRLVEGPAERGAAMARGARVANGDLLMFLWPGTVLDRGWDATLMVFASEERNKDRAAVFTWSPFPDAIPDAVAREAAEASVRRRLAWLGAPYGDQGLVLGRRLYRSLGGHKPWPLLEDVELARRIGVGRMAMFDVLAFNPPHPKRSVLHQAARILALVLMILGLRRPWLAALGFRDDS